MRLDDLRISTLIVALIVQFLFKLRITQGLRQVVVLQPGIEAASNLFNCQLPRVVFVQSLTNATAQQETQLQQPNGQMQLAADLEG